MYTFPELLKQLRKESELTQKELAKILGVSAVLIAMIETGQKEVSKVFIKKLANRLQVQPSSLTPFIFSPEDFLKKEMSQLERDLIKIGQKLQKYLISKKAKKLRSNEKDHAISAN